jgi:hypothetical protein
MKAKAQKIAEGVYWIGVLDWGFKIIPWIHTRWYYL